MPNRPAQKSSTLNRRFVKRPVATRIVKTSEKTLPAAERRAALAAVSARRAVPPPSRLLTARELKERAVRRALASVGQLDPKQATIIEQQMTEIITPKKHFWRRKKFVLALSISVISIAFLGFLVYRNLPDIISQVTAAESGIEAGDPAYIPKGYHRDSIVSEKSGKITITYLHSTNGSFTIIEEKSSWNNSALLTNFVQPTWNNNYSITREQGLTIYISGSNAAWVNGGIFYLISDPTGSLSMSDLHDIAVSI